MCCVYFCFFRHFFFLFLSFVDQMSRYLEKLPYFISHFLGYRKPDYKPKILPAWRIYLWSFLAAWLGIAVLEIVFTYGPSFQAHQTPMIIASFGASAVLIYGAIDSPLAQPRNIICGQIIGAVAGVIISQLFLGIQHTWASEGQHIAVQWVGGSTAMALSLILMQITKTVHPPGGATALIAVTTLNVFEIKWFYIGVVALSAVLQVVIACLINNIERKYPLYWWTPVQLPLKIDPTTLSTVMSTHGTHKDEDVVIDNLTGAEEGRLHYAEDNDNDNDIIRGIAVTATRSSSATALDHHAVSKAIATLQDHASIERKDHCQYILLAAGEPLITSRHVNLSGNEKALLEALLNKLH
ncbi:HPP family-domain-containing protein [Gilbertella persicaria]|uniref:HPP family-domain-containing protein n=1 Tax=Gilbertella persicaria TaxID=101096 RepID=UPI00221FA25F|nr:HPP family-domain-containing protein [Gilbertella persicaria]KAI8058655.1 HPP family-domain-containing protein [Gilbertella persicaria]